jgi:hypothetical protein
VRGEHGDLVLELVDGQVCQSQVVGFGNRHVGRLANVPDDT